MTVQVPQFDRHDVALDGLAGALQGVPAALRSPTTLAALQQSAGAALASFAAAVGERVPAFAASRNPDVLPELMAHGQAHLDELLRLLRGGLPGDLAFVHAHARRRAEQHFPLDAMLHAYRCGHRVFADWMRTGLAGDAAARHDAAVAVADFALEYTDIVSTLAASTYSAHACLLTEVAGDQRAQRLALLLEGVDESDPRVVRALREAGYLEHDQVYCVAVVRALDPAEMLSVARARRLADACAQLCAQRRWRSLVDIRDLQVVLVIADRRRESGWTAPRDSLARRLGGLLEELGNAVVAGVSNDVPATAHIPGAWREARIALALSSPAARVVAFGGLPLTEVLVHLAGPEFRRAMPAWAVPLAAADGDLGGAFLATLEAYAAADMNVLKAAAVLGVHPNTVYARFQRIRDISGREPRAYADLTDLLLVARCVSADQR